VSSATSHFNNTTMAPLLDDRPVTPASPGRVRLPVSKLPFDKSIVFKNSSFFTQKGAPCALPSPAEVRAAANLINTGPRNLRRPCPVRFPSLNLLVKYGREITIAEGQCLWTIRSLLPDVVPVPEVFGWCQDGNEVFIYMQMVRGATLEERWEALTREERVDICEQLRPMVGALRQLEQDPTDRFVGEQLSLTLSGLSLRLKITLCRPHWAPATSRCHIHQQLLAPCWPLPQRFILP